jgi:hypothetical protein
LRPAPTGPYDIPLWSEPKVPRDQLAQVAKALYSLPYAYVRHTLTARADSQTVRFYDRHVLVKTHPRQPPGGRSIDPHDYPAERSVYALRDVHTLQRQASSYGEAIGRFAAAVLDSPLPWTRMRRVYALLGLTRKYGAARVNDACVLALAAEMLDVHRLKRMLEIGDPAPPQAPHSPHRPTPVGPRPGHILWRDRHPQAGACLRSNNLCRVSRRPARQQVTLRLSRPRSSFLLFA